MCDLCIEINEKLLNPKLSPTDRALWKDLEAKPKHLQLIRQSEKDRYGYPPYNLFLVVQFLVSCNFCVYRYEIRILEAKNSDNLMSSTIDGSDNSEYGFPYWADKTKGTQKR